MRPIFVFDAYGTLFDVHAAIGSHRKAAGPEADRCAERCSKPISRSMRSRMRGKCFRI